MEITMSKVEIEEIENLINSGKLTRWLADNICNTSTLLFILQTLFDAVDKAKTDLD